MVLNVAVGVFAAFFVPVVLYFVACIGIGLFLVGLEWLESVTRWAPFRTGRWNRWWSGLVIGLASGGAVLLALRDCFSGGLLC